MRNSGVTLMELIVVIAIIGVLVVALGFSFQGWMGGYKVEKATNELYTDIMDARARAMQRNRSHFLWATASGYGISDDTNENGAIDAGETVTTFPKRLEYTLTWSTVPFTFDKRGQIFPPGDNSIRVNSTAGPDYDCITLSQTRVNMGWWTGGGCSVK